MKTSPNASLFSSSSGVEVPEDANELEVELETGSNSTSNVSAPSIMVLGKISSNGTGT